MIEHFPLLRQAYNYDCGVVAAQAILTYFGFDLRESNLIKISGANKKKGTTIYGITKIFEHFGVKTKVKRLTIKDLKMYLRKKIPVILSLQAQSPRRKVDYENDWVDGHYVVAIGYDSNKIFFEDPSYALSRTFLSYHQLEKRWHDIDGHHKIYENLSIVPIYKKKKKIPLAVPLQ